MADEMWYRRRTWTDEDQSEFFSRLRRSRTGFHKAQYCRIQAYELQQAGNYRAALQLLELMFAEWPSDAQEAASFHQKAECLAKLGDKTGCIGAYRQVFDTQRRMPTDLTNAHLDFGLFIALSADADLYDEALSVLDEFGSSPSFPIQVFVTAAIRALIADATGCKETASRQAQFALLAAVQNHSGFTRHATLGIVTEAESSLVERLKRIALPDL